MKQDIEIVCGDCRNVFVWTIEQQQRAESLVESGQFEKMSKPKRCYDCRQARKAKALTEQGIY